MVSFSFSLLVSKRCDSAAIAKSRFVNAKESHLNYIGLGAID
jgi:hypothetical protein